MPLLLGLAWTLATTGTPQEAQAVITANNQLAFDLYAALRSHDGNLFFSPYSINKTLAMAYAGARGETAREMAAVLHFTLGQERQHRAFLEARKLVNRSLAAGAGPNSLLRRQHAVDLFLAASLWGQRGYGFQKDYLNLLQECYGAGLQEIDFNASERARDTINRWVQKQTRDKVRGLFPAGTLSPNTRLALASAIYFKGDWLQPFSKQRTRLVEFHTGSQVPVQVSMMSRQDTFGYFEDEHVQALRMPYEGKSLAMLVLLPRKLDGLSSLETSLTAEKLADWIARMSDREVSVQLPRFKLAGELALASTLTVLGMKAAFVSGEADFSGMNGGREPLFIGTVTHGAEIEVNEAGTEAAAATGAAINVLSAAPSALQPVPVFRADHPFVFAIADVRSGLILFVGRVVAP